MLKVTSKFLLTDPDLLCTYLSIMAPRTVASDVRSVMYFFDYLNEWMKVLKENGIPFPRSFDLDLLLKCCDIIIELDHHVLCNLLLSFLYNHMRTIAAVPKFRKVLVGERVLRDWFFSLFLHWDSKIRCFFYQLLTFQVLPL
jgi:hypothetical protein